MKQIFLVFFFAIALLYVLVPVSPSSSLSLPKEGFLGNETVFDQKRPVLDDFDVSSTRKESVVREGNDGLPVLETLVVSNPFEEVHEIYGHGYSGYEYNMPDVTNSPEPDVFFPCKRMIDMVGANNFLPVKPTETIPGEPTPLDHENLYSRDKSENGYVIQKGNHVHPLQDVRFLLKDN